MRSQTFACFHYAEEGAARQMFSVLGGQYMNMAEEGQQEHKRATSPSLAETGFLEGVKVQMARLGKNQDWIRRSFSPHNVFVTSLTYCVYLRYWALCVQRAHPCLIFGPWQLAKCLEGVADQ